MPNVIAFQEIDPPFHQLPARDRRKVKRIQTILREFPLDMDELRLQAITKGGLVSNRVREKVWPILLGVTAENFSPTPDDREMNMHKDYNQVVVDTVRCLHRFSESISEAQWKSLQNRLTRMTMRLLVANPELSYYQGLHEVCVTLFLVTQDEDLIIAMANRLIASHFRGFMEGKKLLLDRENECLASLILKASPRLSERLKRSQCDCRIFYVGWILTWFSHMLENKKALRIFDHFIACQPLMSVYLTAAIFLHKKKEILAEQTTVEEVLKNIELPDLPLEKLLRHAGKLFVRYPPQVLDKQTVRLFKREMTPRTKLQRNI